MSSPQKSLQCEGGYILCGVSFSLGFDPIAKHENMVTGFHDFRGHFSAQLNVSLRLLISFNDFCFSVGYGKRRVSYLNGGGPWYLIGHQPVVTGVLNSIATTVLFGLLNRR